MPARELWRLAHGRSSPASRRVVGRQFAIALGSVAGMWFTAWMISVIATQPALASYAGSQWGGTVQPNLPRLLGYSALYVGGATLILVLLSVQVLRFVVSSSASMKSAARAPRILLLAFALMLPSTVQGQAVDNLTAEREYRAVLELDPDQSRATFRLAQLLEQRDRDEAERLYRRYIELEPEDAWGYIALAELLGRDRRYDEAVSLYDAAFRLEPNESDAVDGRTRMVELQEADRSNGPAVEPSFSISRDSDGNTRVRSVIAGDVAVVNGMRVGLSIGHTRISDMTGDRTLKDFMFTTAVRPNSTLQFDAAVGAVRLAQETLSTARLRLRASTPANKARMDLRFNRTLLDATPLLTANRVVRNEVTIRPDVAVGSHFRLRGIGGAGWMTGGEENNRYTTGGGAAWNLAPAIDLSANFTQVQYRRTSSAGYFAPARIHTADIGSYMEFETESTLIALDFGAGVERFREHGARFGAWRPALRGYGLLAFRLRPGRELRFELDGSNTQAGPVAAPTSSWKYGSVSASFRWTL